MSDAPERIWIDRHGGNWSPCSGGTQDVEYVRADLFTALQAERDAWKARAEAAVVACRKAHDALWELNPNNYDHDDVCKANDGAIEAILTLAPIIGETHGKPPEWWAARLTPPADLARGVADD